MLHGGTRTASISRPCGKNSDIPTSRQPRYTCSRRIGSPPGIARESMRLTRFPWLRGALLSFSAWLREQRISYDLGPG